MEEFVMAEITPALVKTLRDRTNAPFGDCKKALVEADGDMEKAIEILRKKNTAIQAKASGRETGDGRVGLWVSGDGSTGGLVDLRCESAPVAKNEMFVELATDLAKQVAMKGVAASAQAMVDEAHHSQAGKTVKERIADVVGLLRENIQPHRMARYEGGQVGGYVHHDGTVGVLVHCEGTKSDQALLRDVAMHIVARTPMAISRDKVDPALIEKEREVSKAQAALEEKRRVERENRRKQPSAWMTTRDEGTTWSEPRAMHPALTGDRHTLRYAKDGRLVAVFRDTRLDGDGAWRGDFIAWVGTFDDIQNGNGGQYRVRLLDNQNAWDCGYPGLEALPDGTLVATTYGHWEKGQQPWIQSVRFTLAELDALAAQQAPSGAQEKADQEPTKQRGGSKLEDALDKLLHYAPNAKPPSENGAACDSV
jgi:elongation factor Ts